MMRLLTSAHLWFYNGPAERKRLGYDRLGNVLTLDELIIAGASVTAVNPQSYSYDARGRLTDFANTGQGISHHYGYDPSGNRTEKAVNGGQTVYTPKPDSNRLATVGATAYTYDDAGNLKNNGGAAQSGYDARDKARLNTP
jgi:YD repeat-containing protein